jgi:hypothetical protein
MYAVVLKPAVSGAPASKPSIVRVVMRPVAGS